MHASTWLSTVVAPKDLRLPCAFPAKNSLDRLEFRPPLSTRRANYSTFTVLVPLSRHNTSFLSADLAARTTTSRLDACMHAAGQKGNHGMIIGDHATPLATSYSTRLNHNHACRGISHSKCCGLPRKWLGPSQLCSCCQTLGIRSEVHVAFVLGSLVAPNSTVHASGR